jgi:hypothetical protein
VQELKQRAEQDEFDRWKGAFAIEDSGEHVETSDQVLSRDLELCEAIRAEKVCLLMPGAPGPVLCSAVCSPHGTAHGYSILRAVHNLARVGLLSKPLCGQQAEKTPHDRHAHDSYLVKLTLGSISTT